MLTRTIFYFSMVVAYIITSSPVLLPSPLIHAKFAITENLSCILLCQRNCVVFVFPYFFCLKTSEVARQTPHPSTPISLLAPPSPIIQTLVETDKEVSSKTLQIIIETMSRENIMRDQEKIALSLSTIKNIPQFEQCRRRSTGGPADV